MGTLDLLTSDYHLGEIWDTLFCSSHFTEEFFLPLVDVGGGSGTGSLYMNDSVGQKNYKQCPRMDRFGGRSYLYFH